jgi:hypothetical protein
MAEDNLNRIQISVKTAMLSPSFLYPSAKFLPILKTEAVGRQVGSISLERDELLWAKYVVKFSAR